MSNPAEHRVKTAADSRQLGLPWLSPVSFCPTHSLGAERKGTTKQIRKGLRTYRNRRTQVLLAGMAASCSACEEDEGRPCFVGGLPCSRSLSLPPLPSPSSRCPLTLSRRSICSGLVWVDLIWQFKI